MRLLGAVLLAGLILAVLKPLLIALLLVLGILLLYGAFFRTQETFGLFAFWGGWALLDRHPLMVATALAVLSVVPICRGSLKNKKAEQQSLLDAPFPRDRMHS